MRKIAFLLAVLLCLGSMFVACNDEPADTTAAQTPETTDTPTDTVPETTEASTPDPEPESTSLTLNFKDNNLCTSKYEGKGEGAFSTYTAWVSTDYIEIDGFYGIEYELAAHKLLQSVAFYTAEKQYISGIGTTSMLSSTTTVMGFTTVPENAKYARFISYTGHGDMPAYTDCFVNGYADKENYDMAYGESEYRELVIACLGDSLTEGDYGSTQRGVANRHYKNYPYFLAKELGCTTVNYGKCGANSQSFYQNYYQKGNVDIANADVIVIMLGTNRGLEGTYTDYYSQLIKDVKKDMKDDAVLILVTPPSATIDKLKVNFGYMTNISNAYYVVKQQAKKEKLDLIDAFKYSPIQPATEDEYQANDGLHMVEAGYKAFAEYMAEEIVKILNSKK